VDFFYIREVGWILPCGDAGSALLRLIAVRWRSIWGSEGEWKFLRLLYKNPYAILHKTTQSLLGVVLIKRLQIHSNFATFATKVLIITYLYLNREYIP
jgi:hypothetical protein